MDQSIGIYLGERHAAVAACLNGVPRVLQSREAQPTTACVVGVKKRRGRRLDDNGQILVGDVAVDHRPLAPCDTILSIRRLMGRAYSDPEVQKVRDWADYQVVKPSDGTEDNVCVIMGNKEYSPEDISAMILRKLKSDAEFRIGSELAHAVITIPMYFGMAQRVATQRAGLKAGFREISLLEESIAAVLACDKGASKNPDLRHILICELDGDAVHLSVVRQQKSVFTPLQCDGDASFMSDLGHALVERALERTRMEYGLNPRDNKRFMAALERAANETQKRLISAGSADLIVAGILRDEDGEIVDVELEITRDEYVKAVQPFAEKIVSLTKSVLVRSGLSSSDVDAVLMVGDSPWIPAIRAMVGATFEKHAVRWCIDSQECFARGAALCGEQLGRSSDDRV